MVKNRYTRSRRGRGLSKSKIMAHRQCPKRLWLEVCRPDLLDDSGSEAAFAAGHAVGELARDLHPGGVLIEAESLSEALSLTQGALAAKPRKPLYEATFEYEGTLIRADLLLPRPRGYRLVEVKASGSVKPHYLEDVAVQAWVMDKAGIPLKRLELAHVDTQWTYPGGEDYEGLLTYEDVTAEVKASLGEVESWVGEARKTLTGDEPDIPPGPQCSDPYECPFMHYCIPPVPEGTYPLSDLPRGGKVAKALEEEGYTDLRQVPASRLSNRQHRIVHLGARSGRRFISAVAGQELAERGWPRRYLDFESLQFAVPIWAGTRPYQQVPFQWSCHIETAPGKVVHREFLAETPEDPRRAFAESLVEVLGDDEGPIFVYFAAFERGRMLEMAETFPDLAPQLEQAVERIVDLHPLVRDNYYHRDQHGSWSLKAVLPTIAPKLAYSDLEIAEGGSAAEAYRSLLDPEMPAEEVERVRTNLLEYCGRDTLALVRIAHYLEVHKDDKHA